MRRPSTSTRMPVSVLEVVAPNSADPTECDLWAAVNATHPAASLIIPRCAGPGLPRSLSEARLPRITIGDKFLYSEIRKYYSRFQGDCFPGEDLLSLNTGLSVTQVSDGIQRLQAASLLKVVSRTGKCNGGIKTTNNYEPRELPKWAQYRGKLSVYIIPKWLMPRTELSQTAKLIYTIIASKADARFYCWAKLQELGSKAALDQSVVSKAVKELVAIGLVVKLRRRRTYFCMLKHAWQDAIPPSISKIRINGGRKAPTKKPSPLRLLAMNDEGCEDQVEPQGLDPQLQGVHHDNSIAHAVQIGEPYDYPPAASEN